MKKSATCEHEFGPPVQIKEQTFGVVYGSYETCKKCGVQRIENWCETRASGGTPRLYPPGTIKAAPCPACKGTGVLEGDKTAPANSILRCDVPCPECCDP